MAPRYVLGDVGYVELVSCMGNDKTIVNAARQSCHHELQDGGELTDADKRLLARLFQDRHTSPFEMVEFVFAVRAPLFVIAQWQRHRTWSYNEESLRYHESPLDFYTPETWRAQCTTNKQSSAGEIPWQDTAAITYYNLVVDAVAAYRNLLELGVAREQARMVLPVSLMKTMIAKVDLHNLLHFLRLRLAADAQEEIRLYADAILWMIKDHVPYTAELFERSLYHV